MDILLVKKNLYGKFKILNESKFISTKPIGVVDQSDFVNGVLLVQTELSLEEFRSQLKEIEVSVGRIPFQNKNYGPRIIDIDILVWNDNLIDRDFYERDFLRSFVLELSHAVKH